MTLGLRSVAVLSQVSWELFNQ